LRNSFLHPVDLEIFRRQNAFGSSLPCKIDILTIAGGRGHCHNPHRQPDSRPSEAEPTVPRLLRSDFSIAESTCQGISSYLLLAIGLKGGAVLAVTPASELLLP
jgi:hypothetical protein